MAKRLWIALAGLGAIGASFAALLLLGWTIDETHFDRPDAGFDRLATRIDALPGVRVEDRERWVEAPGFSEPSSYIWVAVDEAGLPGLLAAACASEHPDPVSWALRIEARGGSTVSVHSDPDPEQGTGGSSCLDPGFDAPGLVGAVDGLGADTTLQPAFWDGGRFALVAVEDGVGTLEGVLPLLARADALREAAGLGADRSVEINAQALGVIIQPGEHDRYLALISELHEEHGVTAFWADGGGEPIDGVRKVQVAAPPEEHAAVEERIRDSALGIADLPVRFLPPEPPSVDGG